MTSYPWRVAAAAANHCAVPVHHRPRLLRRLGVGAPDDLQMYSGAHLGGRSIRFGAGVFVNHGLFYDGEAPVTVEDQVAFGPNVSLITATHEIGGRRRRCTSEPVAASITVGTGSWLAANVSVLPGVRIGPGCVLAAGAVVTADTDAHGLYAGVPARRLRDLSP